MFINDESIDNLQQLFVEFKKYLELQREYTQLEITEKLTILFSTFITVIILIILGKGFVLCIICTSLHT